MLKKINRISKEKEFKEILKKGKINHSPAFAIKWLKGEGEKQFGVVVSKKISNRAVDRNKVRRRIMEAVYRNWQGFPEGIKIVFLVKKNILEKKTDALEKDIAGIIKIL